MTSKKLLCGIDPGAKGALVVLDEDGTVIAWLLMPMIKQGTQERVNAAAVAAFLKPYAANITANLELVGAMPGQGVASMFSFGHSAGVVTGVLGALEIPVTLITPQKWTKHFNLGSKTKSPDQARGLAARFWPAWRELDFKGKGGALADAALIARYSLGLNREAIAYNSAPRKTRHVLKELDETPRTAGRRPAPDGKPSR